MKELICIGISCPLPIVKIGKAVKDMQTGDQLKVSADDPAFEVDVEAWGRKTGHEVKVSQEGNVYYAEITLV